jgi:major type 1 subunit fimbrin (pilin)
MKMIGFKHYIQCTALVLMASLSLSVRATNCSIPAPVLTIPATLTVNDDAPVGSLIGAWSYTTMNINCYKDTIYEWHAFHRLYTSLPLVSGVTALDGGVTYNVYQTGTAGVGIAIGFQNVDKGNAWETVTTDQATNAYTVARNQVRFVDMLSNGAGGAYNTAAQFKVAFVKTEGVRNSFNTGGLTVVNYYPVWYYRNSPGGSLALDTSRLVYANIQISPVQFNVTPPACTVTSGTANLVVPLPAAAVSDFVGGVGSTAKPTSFTIGLMNCNKHPLVTLSLAGTADTDYSGAAISGVLKVTSTSATGVGIQLLNNMTGNPAAFPLNKATYLGTVSGAGKADTFTIPMVARYFQTKTKMTAGLVTASATINLTYN